MVLWRVVSIALLAILLHVPTAYSAPGDPPAGSPAGTVYELPLERGRTDAAPRANPDEGVTGDTRSGEDTGGANGSEANLYRSENNFGSSSRVPGLPRSGGDDGGGGTGPGGSDNSAGQGSGGGVGGGPGDDGRGGEGLPTEGSASADSASIATGVLVLMAIVAAATALGLLSRRFRGARGG